MKIVKLLLVVALFAVAGVARANNYDYSYNTQEEVVIGEEGVPAPHVGNEGVESYGVMPSWANGCCERQPSKADHLWDNYCFEKHSHCCKSQCCGKTFCGTGPFSKGCCCESKCGPKFRMPKLNVWNNCCQKASCCKTSVKGCTQKLGNCCQKAKSCCQKSTCCQKAPCCKETKCCTTSRCHKPLLSKFRLFRGCHGSKCGKGKGGAVVDAGYRGTDVPTPAIEGEVIEDGVIEMPNEVPPAPPITDPAA